MHARLIHNAGAGGGSKGSTEELVRLLERAGYAVRHEHYDPERIGAWVDDGSELVVAAGGDGTIGAVASAMSGRAVPLAIVPTGTANNIGGSLGLSTGPSALYKTLRSPSVRSLDLGVVQGSWGQRLFVEGAGVGLFQHTLEHEASDDDKAPETAVRLLRNVLDRFEARRFHVELDGRTIVGRFLLIEAMNVACFGPNLRLAPSADCSDGVLDVVLAAEHDRPALERYLDRRLEGDDDVTADLPVERARRVLLRTEGSPLRVDDRVHPDGEQAPPVQVEVRLRPRDVTLLVPAG